MRLCDRARPGRPSVPPFVKYRMLISRNDCVRVIIIIKFATCQITALNAFIISITIIAATDIAY